jgi:hypothetical protein
MLAKCANPACGTKFLYLREGKLYLIDVKGGSIGYRSSADPRQVDRAIPIEYFWLFSSCCRVMTIEIDRRHEIRVVRKCEDMNEPVMPSHPMVSVDTIVQ